MRFSCPWPLFALWTLTFSDSFPSWWLWEVLPTLGTWCCPHRWLLPIYRCVRDGFGARFWDCRSQRGVGCSFPREKWCLFPDMTSPPSFWREPAKITRSCLCTSGVLPRSVWTHAPPGPPPSSFPQSSWQLLPCSGGSCRWAASFILLAISPYRWGWEASPPALGCDRSCGVAHLRIRLCLFPNSVWPVHTPDIDGLASGVSCWDFQPSVPARSY